MTSYQIKAYEKAQNTVSVHCQVMMIYHEIIQLVSQAKKHMNSNKRLAFFDKAINIILYLERDLDVGVSKDLSESLYQFYMVLSGRLSAIKYSGNYDECDRVITDLREFKEVWSKLGQ